MNSEQIRSACERAESLSAVVVDDTLRPHAFSVILQTMLLPERAEVKSSSANHGKDSEGTSKVAAKSQKTARGRSRQGGLKSRLVEMQVQGFFGEPRDVKEIGAELSTAGWHHEGKEISARLLELVREKVLRRSSRTEGKSLQYSNW